ncbi:morphinone reductase [Pseudomonas sp. FH4]|uniref:alkene reductase n=1 Tax=Pseudomonas TaxID=286 RepID=UPI0003DB7312|nr:MULTISPECIES: alkene reductase [Pseudomonas]ETK20209.1 morphinone reductase [Pseudomonas sp. FH4]MBF8006192.1 alkene reductase [Pseudomonas brenneri]WJM92585.1 alkene reductase [Pseudomonas brenneri]CRM51733.1 N-ethylmaleimide reductase [Pseudomonas sp. 25 R 14]
MSKKLYSPLPVGPVLLPNRLVMAPMTRSRAAQPGDIPVEINATYYAQRASAGLIISEGTQVSRQGQGYAYTPGIFSPEQLAGWRTVTDAVHAAGGRIAAQLWHVGRMSHGSMQLEGEKPLAPSAITAKAQVFVSDMKGGGTMAPAAEPREMTVQDFKQVRQEFVQAARAALSAGFDLVEMHGANGYLFDQFLATGSNRRTDDYGGSVENRARFLLETLDAMIAVVGAERIGLRLSPWGSINDIQDDEPEAMTLYLAGQLQQRGLAYLHIAEWEWAGGAPYPQGFRERLRAAFNGPLIVCGNYDGARAEAILQAGLADAVAIGRPFIANPDLVQRIHEGASLSVADQSTFYGGGAAGYIDYPTLS